MLTALHRHRIDMRILKIVFIDRVGWVSNDTRYNSDLTAKEFQ
jgi:hypothetical protein